MNEIRDIHEPLCRWLDKNRIPFHRNRPDKKTTAIKGDPDFLCTLANRCIYVECKVPGKKPSEVQEKRIAYLRQAGNTVKIAYSCEEAILAISEYFGVVNGAGEANRAENEPSGACRHEWDMCTGPDGDSRVGKLICMFCGVPKGNDLSEGESETPKSEGIQLGSSPSQNLFIGNIGGKDYVLDGDPKPGGIAKMVRTATAADLINIPRR